MEAAVSKKKPVVLTCTFYGLPVTGAVLTGTGAVWPVLHPKHRIPLFKCTECNECYKKVEHG